MRRKWAEAAFEKLRAGETVQIEPQGDSMRGRINAGETITLKPCDEGDLATGDVVLARIQGRRHSHLVLHLIIERSDEKFLIGNNFGRVDGWITSENIFGKVVEVKPPSSK